MNCSNGFLRYKLGERVKSIDRYKANVMIEEGPKGFKMMKNIYGDYNGSFIDMPLSALHPRTWAVYYDNDLVA